MGVRLFLVHAGAWLCCTQNPPRAPAHAGLCQCADLTRIASHSYLNSWHGINNIRSLQTARQDEKDICRFVEGHMRGLLQHQQQQVSGRRGVGVVAMYVRVCVWWWGGGGDSRLWRMERSN